MSQAVEPLRGIRQIDKRIDLTMSEKGHYAVLETGQNLSYITVQPNGSANASLLSFTANPPGTGVFVGRKPLLTCTFVLTFNGTTTLAPLLQASEMNALPGVPVGNRQLDAPRCDALNQAISNIAVNLNNDRVSTNLGQYARLNQRYGNWMEDSKKMLSPAYPDQSLEYSDLTTSNRSPLVGYSSSSGFEGRAGFVGCVLQSNTATQAVVRLTVSTLLNISPFVFENATEKEVVGLIGIQNCDIQIALSGRNSLVNALWSHNTDSTAVFTSITSQMETSSLTFSYITPPQDMKIPASLSYDYNEVQLYPTNTNITLAPGGSATLEMNAITLGSIPSRVYVFAGSPDSAHSITKTDTFFRVDGVNVSFGNQSGILSSANSRDLFQMSGLNGCNLSFSQWSQYVGSPLCMAFGEDIPLQYGDSVGVRGSFTFRLSLNVTNIFSSAQLATLYVVIVSEGVLQIINGSVLRSVGVLTRDDVARALDSKMVHPHSRPSSMMGGRMDMAGGKIDWKKLWNTIKSGAKTVSNIASKIVPVLAPQYAPEMAVVDRLIQGAGMIGGTPIGGSLIGGAQKPLSRAQLKRMLHQ